MNPTLTALLMTLIVSAVWISCWCAWGAMIALSRGVSARKGVTHGVLGPPGITLLLIRTRSDKLPQREKAMLVGLATVAVVDRSAQSIQQFRNRPPQVQPQLGIAPPQLTAPPPPPPPPAPGFTPQFTSPPPPPPPPPPSSGPPPYFGPPPGPAS